MAEQKDKLLWNAGALLMAAGFISAFTGGMYGLARTQPALVVMSVLLLIGYGVVGYLLTSRGAAYFSFVLPASAVLVLATLFVLPPASTSAFDGDIMGDAFLYPALTLVLAFAAGALLTHAIEESTRRVVWPGKGAPSLNPLLHVAAYAPVWNAFTLLTLMGNPAVAMRVIIIGASVAASIACVVAGYASARRTHPVITLIGAGVGFLASCAYIFQFMLGGGERGGAYFGAFNALIGLILTGLPIAIAAVAWIQIASEEPRELEPINPTMPQ